MSDACTRKWTESTSEERVQNFCVGQEYSRTAPALHFSSVKRKKRRTSQRPAALIQYTMPFWHRLDFLHVLSKIDLDRLWRRHVSFSGSRSPTSCGKHKAEPSVLLHCFSKLRVVTILAMRIVSKCASMSESSLRVLHCIARLVSVWQGLELQVFERAPECHAHIRQRGNSLTKILNSSHNFQPGLVKICRNPCSYNSWQNSATRAKPKVVGDVEFRQQLHIACLICMNVNHVLIKVLGQAFLVHRWMFSKSACW